MICKVYSADICGIDAFQICVEADVSAGLPAFTIVGLPSSEVREARERVERAIVNSGFEFPPRRITINLSPAYLRKQGSGFDLPIAVAVLAATGAVRQEALAGRMFIGELSLDGAVNPVRGVLPIAVFARNSGFDCIVMPKDNEFEGAAVDGIKIHGTSDLKTLCGELNAMQMRDVEHTDLDSLIAQAATDQSLDYADVIGQEGAKKAVMVAAAGFHNILFVGPPGAGKSMIAKRIPTIFNRLTKDECLEISKIYSIAGLLKDNSLILTRPFRSPHQNITDAALLGGSSSPRPGEITLAHRGVLFLDELTEFRRGTINELRTPLEEKKITINRAAYRAEFPCDFMLASSANPCPCGWYPARNICTCSETDINRYISKIKGPILDRIDICAHVSKVETSAFSSHTPKGGMSSADMREKVLKAQEIQQARFAGSAAAFNSQMTRQEIEQYCVLDSECRAILTKAYDRFNMTARGWYKILKVSRTIADLDGQEDILKRHIMEAISYRNTFLNS